MISDREQTAQELIDYSTPTATDFMSLFYPHLSQESELKCVERGLN